MRYARSKKEWFREFTPPNYTKKQWVQIIGSLFVLIAISLIATVVVGIGTDALPPGWRSAGTMLLATFGGFMMGRITEIFKSHHRKHVLQIVRDFVQEMHVEMPNWLWKRINIAIDKP